MVSDIKLYLVDALDEEEFMVKSEFPVLFKIAGKNEKKIMENEFTHTYSGTWLYVIFRLSLRNFMSPFFIYSRTQPLTLHKRHLKPSLYSNLTSSTLQNMA